MDKSKFTPILALIYMAAFIIASAGAIANGFANSEHIYTVAGILNIMFGGFWSYKVWKESSKIVKEK